MKKAEWLFFDVGSTLVDEEEACRHRARDMIRGTGVTFGMYWEKRTEFALRGLDGDRTAIEYFGLSKTPWHSEDEVPFEDCEGTLRALRDRGYRLGVIANQVPGLMERLSSWGLAGYFSVVASSAELGTAKPDKEIFVTALEMARCAPRDAVMVGDRPDNDVRPAKELGMRTIRVARGIAAYRTPSCPEEVPDITVGSLSELLEYF